MLHAWFIRNNNGIIKTLLLPVVVAIGAGQLLDSMLISYGKDDHFYILNLLTTLINKPIFLNFKFYVIFTYNLKIKILTNYINLKFDIFIGKLITSLNFINLI